MSAGIRVFKVTGRDQRWQHSSRCPNIFYALDTHLFFEGELIDAATNKTVMKVVRKGEGKELANENTPMGFATLKQVVDDMATDATMFDVHKTAK